MFRKILRLIQKLVLRNVIYYKTKGILVNCNMNMIIFKENFFDIVISSMMIYCTENNKQKKRRCTGACNVA